MGLEKRKENNLEFHKYPVGFCRKDINKIGRSKFESDKERGTIKKSKQITQEELDHMLAVAKRERDLGMMEYCRDRNGNRLTEVNRFLFDTRLQPKERICYRYIATPTQCRGKLRDKSIISVNFEGPFDFDLYYNSEFMKNFRNQKDVVKHIKKLIGYKK